MLYFLFKLDHSYLKHLWNLFVLIVLARFARSRSFSPYVRGSSPATCSLLLEILIWKQHFDLKYWKLYLKFTGFAKLTSLTSGTARSSSHQLKVLYFLLKRDFANRPVISSRPRPLPVVIADHAIIPGIRHMMPMNK